MKATLKGIDPGVFWGSAIIIAGFVVWGLVAPENLGAIMSATLSWIISNFGWAFVLIATGRWCCASCWCCTPGDASGSGPTTPGPTSGRSPGSR